MPVQAWRERVSSEKRGAILAAASAAFASEGFTRVAIADVARAAGVSSATVFKHFPTKDALFEAVVSALVERFTAEPALGLDPDQPMEVALTAFGRAYLRFVADPLTLGLLRMVIAEAPHQRTLGARFLDAGKGPIHARLYAYLRTKHASGELTVADAPRATASFMGMLNQSALLPALFEGRAGATAGAPDAIVREAVETLLTRYRAPEPKPGTVRTRASRRR